MVEKALGSPVKVPVEAEREMRDIARRSIMAKVDIPLGTVITEDMLVFKRPGTGVSPKHLYKIVGNVSISNIKKDSLINLKMFEAT